MLLSGSSVVEEERKPQTEPELPDRRHRRVEHAEEDRLPEQLVLEQVLEILEADPLTAASDRRIRERQPDAEPERVGEKRQQQSDGGQQAHEDKERLPVEQGRTSQDGWAAPADQRGRAGATAACRIEWLGEAMGELSAEIPARPSLGLARRLLRRRLA